MGMRLLLAGVLLFLGGGAAMAEGGYYSGNALLRDCGAPIPYNRGVCLGYVAGVAQMLAYTPVEGHRACIPREVNERKLQDQVIVFLEMRRRERPAVLLVAEALEEAYPCSAG